MEELLIVPAMPTPLQRPLRVLVSAGGTAGHVLPALTVLKALSDLLPPHNLSTPVVTPMFTPQTSGPMSASKPDALPSKTSVSAANSWAQGLTSLFVGEAGGMERELVCREGIPFESIEAGAMNGVGGLRQLKAAARLTRGTAKALHIVGRFKPDVVLLTGGFVGVPVSWAAWLRRVPTLVYLPDIEPGMALKVMARLANQVATTTDASAQFIPPAKMVVTGYPVREGFRNLSKAQARETLGISADEKVLLVFGGSKGARSINTAVVQNLDALLQQAVVVHVTGANDWDAAEAARNKLTAEQQARYLAFKYLHEEMAAAMTAADLTICRSGASALGELTYMGLPAVLVPYPYAWRFQKVNAAYLVEHGAAVMMEDATLERELIGTVTQLLGDSARLQALHEASLKLGQRDGAHNIAHAMLRLAGAGASAVT